MNAKPYEVRTQQSFQDDRWMFWIIAPNNATVGKSARRYTTERGAVRAAVNMLNAWRNNGIKVVTR